MIKSRNSNKKLLKLCVAFLFPFTLFGGLAATNMTADAASTTTSYVKSWEEKVTLTNSSFTEGGSTYLSGNNLSGWNAIEEQSRATGMLIDVGTGTNTDGSGANSTFSNNQDIYMLQQNPGTKGGSDSRILMINSKTNQSSSGVLAQKGYRSNSVTLEANSYYRFSVSVKTDTNGDDNVSASVYVSGLKDLDGKELSIGYENLSNNIWKTYYIFIATGNESQTVTLDLYLGSAHGGVSSGVVFFDECYINRYSQNAFMDLCRDRGYVGSDTFEDYNSSTCFLINGLKDNSNLIDTSELNFNFEDKIEGNSDTLGDKWTARTQNGHAIIADIRNMQPSEFKDYYTKGLYNYIGDDLTDGNTNAMILYTDRDGGYVQANSADFEIEAHKVYKFSVNMKVSAMTAGSFYVQVSENGNIYDMYPALVSEDEESEIYYQLQSGKSSGYSSNVENNFTNSYQTIDFFVKGHQLYDTSVNLQFLLGDSETQANGCVVIDNITAEYATNEDFTAATNKLELASFASTPEDNSQIANAYFNSTQIDEQKYPIKAADWSSEVENEKYNQSGVVYLYNSEQFLEKYNKDYDWAGIFPGMPNNSTGVDLPNNVYLMYNSRNSYQSITSSSYALSSNSYYKLSFDYKNQDGLGNVQPSAIKVEIIDENGITLYSRDGISSSEWNSCEIYFHTAEAIAHDIQIKVSLGTENNPVGGQVYLDNFIVENFTEDENAAEIFEGASEREKADLTDFYLHLSENGEIGNTITDSPAYSVNIDEVYDKGLPDSSTAAIGGIVSGSNNPYGEEFKLDDNNFLALQTLSASKATISSKFPLSLEADKYYKLTFDLGTLFAEGAENAKSDEHDCKYGVTVTIDGYESVSQLVTARQLQNYSIYIKSSEASTPKISFTIVSDCHQTRGLMLVSNIDFTAVEEVEYTNAALSSLYGERVFTADATETDTDDDNTDDGDDTTTDGATPDDNNSWLLIPSIIMAVALIVAIVGFALRKVKIKKIEKIRKETYDRKLAINHDAIMVEAQKRRDIEVEELMQAKNKLEADKAELEAKHKEFVKENRSSNVGKISRELERALKKYNSDMIRINEKINIIKEKIDHTMSADYLLTLERKIVAEEEDAFRAEKRAMKNEYKKIRSNNPDKK